MAGFSKEKLLENSIDRLGREMHELCNATGFQVDITTLTAIKAKVTEQKFYEVTPSDYMPVIAGQSPWAEDVLTWKSFSPSENFEAGIIETGSNDGRLARSDAKFESVRVPRKVWGNTINYNLPELAQATLSGNWSLVEAKETSRFKNWQLGIQKVAFLGMDSDTRIKGLLTQTNVTINTTVITKKLNTMTPTEFQAFLGTVLATYYANANSTVLPDTFTIPTDDFLGLVNSVDESFPLKSRLERLNEAFQQGTMNPDFKILPLAYAQTANNGLGVNRYTMYRRNDDTSLTMEIPVDYTTTIQDTINGFQYSSVGYGQFSGAEAFRPAEMIYFDF